MQRKRTCWKICYDTAEEAWKAARGVVKRLKNRAGKHRKNGKQVRVYYCKECCAYHTTSQKRSPKGKKKW